MVFPEKCINMQYCISFQLFLKIEKHDAYCEIILISCAYEL